MFCITYTTLPWGVLHTQNRQNGMTQLPSSCADSNILCYFFFLCDLKTSILGFTKVRGWQTHMGLQLRWSGSGGIAGKVGEINDCFPPCQCQGERGERVPLLAVRQHQRSGEAGRHLMSPLRRQCGEECPKVSLE